MHADAVWLCLAGDAMQCSHVSIYVCSHGKYLQLGSREATILGCCSQRCLQFPWLLIPCLMPRLTDVQLLFVLACYVLSSPAFVCRYYNSEVHKAAFVLPQYAREALKDTLTHC